MMIVQTIEITDEQLEAGRKAMTGRFTKAQIEHALIGAGVPIAMPNARSISGYAIADRAADRLLQQERKAGRIRAINNKNWERVDA